GAFDMVRQPLVPPSVFIMVITAAFGGQVVYQPLPTHPVVKTNTTHPCGLRARNVRGTGSLPHLPPH
ncbi:MAG TPA: hypothetical protein PK384_15100, partial [Candidatus Latescibacteria bacterium]|nr:hypothetical protein [Candidatus Latescibacterota bacterium]